MKRKLLYTTLIPLVFFGGLQIEPNLGSLSISLTEKALAQSQRRSQSRPRGQSQSQSRAQSQSLVGARTQIELPPSTQSQGQLHSQSQNRVDALLRAYSESPAVSLAIDYAMRNRYSRSAKRCYAHVKMALFQSHGGRGNYSRREYTKATENEVLTSRYLSGNHAKTAGSELEREGFINLLEERDFSDIAQNPLNAPIGTILVYNARGSGHVEIRTPDGVVSDFFSPLPVTGSSGRGNGFELIGAYVKLTTGPVVPQMPSQGMGHPDDLPDDEIQEASLAN